jgi:hypothetical protein
MSHAVKGSSNRHLVPRALLLSCVSLIAMAATQEAEADIFNAADWTTYGAGTTGVTMSPGEVVLQFSYFANSAGAVGPFWDFYTIAPTTGTLGFQWHETANGGPSNADISGYLAFADVTTGFGGSPPYFLNRDAGLFTATGSAALPVTAGDQVRLMEDLFCFCNQNFVGGTITLTMFTGIGNVPEPMSSALFGVGLGGLAAARWRRHAWSGRSLPSITLRGGDANECDVVTSAVPMDNCNERRKADTLLH